MNAPAGEGENALQQLENMQFGGNPSYNNLQKIKMDIDVEKKCQWVRATYPYVDAYRAPLLGLFEDGITLGGVPTPLNLNISQASKYYRSWSERYTLVKSWMFRSGHRWENDGAAPRLKPSAQRQQPLQLYVMLETYPRQQNQPVANKGNESWRQDANRAEDLFTLIGFARRGPKNSLFLPNVMKAPSVFDSGTAAYGQAMVYNANEPEAVTADGSGTTQPNVGWDTLNWEPSVTAPEHGSEPTKARADWPWELFTGASGGSENARVKLNWQAKLIPVTQRRIEAAVDELTRELHDAVEFAAEREYQNLRTH
jgi:hypothetical protein